MPRRSIPRWLRTALVFLASLQAARAGSVEAQRLTNHRMEQATATSAPREPIPALQEPIPVAVVIATGAREQSVVETLAAVQAASPTGGLVVHSVVGAVVTAELPSSGEAGALLKAILGRPALTRIKPHGACRARAPCSAVPLY